MTYKQRWVWALVACLAAGLALAGAAALASAQGGDPGAPGSPGQASSTLPSAFTYHGRLVRSGRPYDGACLFEFRLYDRASSGMQIGDTLTRTLVLVDGVFAATLDFGLGSFDGRERWLAPQVQCASDVGFTALPRQALVASAQALYAPAAAWSGVVGMPAGFADGRDDDTQYQAGRGLTLTGTLLSMNPTLFQQRVDIPCANGYAMREIGQNGAPECEPTFDGDITSVSAGAGLLGGGEQGDVTISADLAYLQRRVAVPPECPPGTFVSGIQATGAVTCEVDSHSTYNVGNQLIMTGTQIGLYDGIGSGLDADLLDGFDSLHYLSASSFDDGVLGYDYFSAWADLDAADYLNNDDGDLAQNNGVVQINLNADQLDGRDSPYLTNATHFLTGTLDTDYYSAYSDLSAEAKLGTENGIAVNTGQLQPGLNAEYLGGQVGSYYQRRVTGTCEPGYAMTQIKSNGGVSCSPVAGGDITSVSLKANPPSGLVLGPGDGQSGDVTVSADLTYLQARVTQSCDPGFAIREIYADGGVDCQPDADGGGSITDIIAGDGLSGGGTSGDVTLTADTTNDLQANIIESCQAGYWMWSIAADGQVECRADADNIMTAGDGLSLSGTTFSANTAAVQQRVGTACPTDQVMYDIQESGTPLCRSRGVALTGVLAGQGLSGGASSGVSTLNGSWTVDSTTYALGCDDGNQSPTNVPMTDYDRSICFLTGFKIRAVDSDNEESWCRIYQEPTDGLWYLETRCGPEGAVEYRCEAHCFQW